jgi:hypothetical protein
MTRLLSVCAQYGGIASSFIFIAITCGQIRAYGYRNWRRLGMGLGQRTDKDVEALLKEEEKRDEREERLMRCIETLETAIEHGDVPM